MKPFKPFAIDGSWNWWAILSILGTAIGFLFLNIGKWFSNAIFAVTGFIIFVFAFLGLIGWISSEVFIKLGMDY